METILYIPNEGRIDEIELTPDFNNKAMPQEMIYIYEGGETTFEIPTPSMTM